MNEQAKKEINAAVLPVIGVLMLCGGVALAGFGVWQRKEATNNGPTFFERPLVQGAASSLGIEIASVPIPPQTRSIAVEYVADYRGRGGYTARARVVSGKTPWTGANSWHSRYEASTYSADHRLGIAPLAGEPVAVSLTLTPPPGGEVLKGRIRLVANPAEARSGDAWGSILFGGFLSILGLLIGAVGVVLRRQVNAERAAAGW